MPLRMALPLWVALPLMVAFLRMDWCMGLFLLNKQGLNTRTGSMEKDNVYDTVYTGIST
jgi:hypothetical protein